jgi:hypothetical protein
MEDLLRKLQNYQAPEAKASTRKGSVFAMGIGARRKTSGFVPKFASSSAPSRRKTGGLLGGFSIGFGSRDGVRLGRKDGEKAQTALDTVTETDNPMRVSAK